MPISQTPRLGLDQFSAGTDPHPNRVKHNEMTGLLENQVARAGQGTLAARPAAGKARTLYYATDEATFYWDTGTAWVEVPGLGGVLPAVPNIDGPASAGVSKRGARADHVHPLPLATVSGPGAMSAGDKSIIDGRTRDEAPGTLVTRDANGRARFADPVETQEAATLGYVNRLVSTQKHDAADIITGVLARERVPLATRTQPGAVPGWDWAAIADRTSSPTPGAVASRDGAGRAQFADPAAYGDAATKGWTDAHKWDASAITTGRLTNDRLPTTVDTITGKFGSLTVAGTGRIENFTAGSIGSWETGTGVDILAPGGEGMHIAASSMGSKNADGSARNMYLVNPMSSEVYDRSYQAPTDASALMTYRGLREHFAVGAATVSSYVAAGDYYRGSVGVTFFGGGFKGVPRVYATANTTVAGAVIEVAVTDITATGCSLSVARSNNTGTVVQYLAVWM